MHSLHQFNVQCHKCNKFRSMKNLHHPALCANLSAVPWKTLLQNLPDVNTMVKIFNEKFLEA